MLALNSCITAVAGNFESSRLREYQPTMVGHGEKEGVLSFWGRRPAQEFLSNAAKAFLE